MHPCPDSDTALEGVFDHRTRTRAEGQDALMLARTRLDVDVLNALACAAAQAAGDVTGPVTTAGERDWQAGDLLGPAATTAPSPSAAPSAGAMSATATDAASSAPDPTAA